MSRFADWVIQHVSQWLLKNDDKLPQNSSYTDFGAMCEHIRPGDVLLVAGRNRVSNIIRHITYSPWSHSSLYIGRLKEIRDPELHKKIKAFYQEDENQQLMIESEMGVGTTIVPLEVYRAEHIRLMRPVHLTEEDAKKVVKYAIGRLGKEYDVRHLLDLARFMFPWGIFPKRWRSSLFEHNALQPTKDICSSMIADAFQAVDFPILPLIEEGCEHEVELIRRNDRLYTPSDFDFSPYI